MVPASNLIAILTGPTATGKTSIALEFARRARRAEACPLEIINADSLLVYRGMNIGTAKPSASELQEVPHHLIDICEPSETFTAGDFAKRVLGTIAQLETAGKRALIVGGSGFYLKALLYGLWEGPPANPELRRELETISSVDLYQELFQRDQESALRIGQNDRYRLVRAHELMRLTGKTPTQLQSEQNRTPDPRFRLLVLDRPTEELHARIQQRTRSMLDEGLVDEVKRVRETFPGVRATEAVGYAQVCDFLDGRAPDGRKATLDRSGLASEIELATRQLVKRQRTWFRGEKSGERFELDRERALLFSRLGEIYS